MFLIKLYYYFFYQIFRHYEQGSVVFWSKWKACLTIVIIEIWTYISLLTYISVFKSIAFELSPTKPIIYIPLAVILLLNYFLFLHDEELVDKYMLKFDQLSKRKNIIGKYLVLSLILLLSGIVVFSFVLLARSIE